SSTGVGPRCSRPPERSRRAPPTPVRTPSRSRLAIGCSDRKCPAPDRARRSLVILQFDSVMRQFHGLHGTGCRLRPEFRARPLHRVSIAEEPTHFGPAVLVEQVNGTGLPHDLALDYVLMPLKESVSVGDAAFQDEISGRAGRPGKPVNKGVLAS